MESLERKEEAGEGMNEFVYSKINLRNDVIANLEKQGFKYKNGKLRFYKPTKTRLRKLNSLAREHILAENEWLIKENEKEFIENFIADGSDIIPSEIKPQLIRVKSDEESLLFRWIKLHWSIPISAGYGRRLRYIVKDKSTDKVIGIFGLADPVFALKDRDNYIGWDQKTKINNLKCIMDGFVIGAVPPYSNLLGGKLIASLASSDRVYRDFRDKYYNTKALISGKRFKKNIALITTTSAYGKSSMYDRIKIPDGSAYLHAGWTSGSGEFQFLNGTYQKLFAVSSLLKASGKKKSWGTGVRNRRVVVREALKNIGLSGDLLYHGIKREVFIAPFGSNWKEYITGEDKRLRLFKKNSVRDISDYMLNRWIIPRSERDNTYLSFNNKEYSLASS
jgi:hypothetical protein